jgi:uncharacterized UBP type Zn finger protein
MVGMAEAIAMLGPNDDPRLTRSGVGFALGLAEGNDMSEACKELAATGEVKLADEAVCVECVAIDGIWVHLRTCQTCGKTHCCDSSPHKHATAHWRATAHPVIASAEPGERWLWCYAHEQTREY